MMTIRRLKEEVQKLNADYNQQLGQLYSYKERVSLIEVKLKHYSEANKTYKKATEVLYTVIKLSQNRFKQDIETLITSMLQTIFGKEFKFYIEYTESRNEINCNFYVKENDRLLDMFYMVAGGAIDVISFGLRLVILLMIKPPLEYVLILDEPFHFLSADKLKLMSVLLKRLRHDFNIQFIITSHQKELAAVADKQFKIEKEANKSFQSYL